MESMYIVRVTEDNEVYDYEYSNIEHAEEQYSTEKQATLLEYVNGKHYFVKAK